MSMFEFDDDARRLAEQCFAFVRGRLGNPPPLIPPPAPDDVARRVGTTITAEGIGADAAMRVFTDVVATTAIVLDSPQHVALLPGAPTVTAALFDSCVSAAALVPEAWIEAAGAIHAENQALRWLADLAAMPASAGGCFVSGGTAGNLSALATARDAGTSSPATAGRRRVAVGADAHSSIANALRVLALDALIVASDDRARLTGPALAAALDRDPDAGDVFAVVATAGSTNAGTIDDLAGVAAVARNRGLWFHVDAAYGGAALCAPSLRSAFTGIEHADSLIIDPHKWLFAPLDCCGLLYREPERARAVHRQSASYLDTMRVEGEWDPTDYALHLTRRARGLPFWFSLAVHGTDAYRDVIESTLARTHAAARIIDASPHLELIIKPELGVLLFRRAGWVESDYVAWARAVLGARTAFVLPTKWRGETVGRFVFLHPNTTLDLFEAVIDAMV
jgi:aromatic-L-amino-acid decarboxylase